MSETTWTDVGVVIPAYREAGNIAALLLAIRAVVPACSIAVIDDSPDLLTVDAARATALDRLIVVHRESKGGRGSAALDGMRRLVEGGCSTIVEMDADFSHAPNEIPGHSPRLSLRRVSRSR